MYPWLTYCLMWIVDNCQDFWNVDQLSTLYNLKTSKVATILRDVLKSNRVKYVHGFAVVRDYWIIISMSLLSIFEGRTASKW